MPAKRSWQWLIRVEHPFILAFCLLLIHFRVLGLILSHISTCEMASFQHGGSPLAPEPIVFTAIIHVIESMILPPRNMGKIVRQYRMLVNAIYWSPKNSVPCGVCC